MPRVTTHNTKSKQDEHSTDHRSTMAKAIFLLLAVLLRNLHTLRAEQPKYSIEYERYPFPPFGLPVKTLADYQLLRRLGTGKFSDVFEAVDVAMEHQLKQKENKAESSSETSVDLRTLVVVKCLKPVSERKIRREICVLQHASRLPNLTRLLAVVIPDDYYAANRQTTDLPKMPCLVLEHAGPSSQWLCHERPNSSSAASSDATSAFLSDYEIRYFLCHLLVALEALHARFIMHRDVKPKNVLINRGSTAATAENNNNNKSNVPLSASPTYRPLMLIDLGLADFYVPGQSYNVRVASRHYKSPELLLNNQYYDYGLDLWGVGCILAGLLLRREPFFRGKDNPDQLSKIVATLGTTDLLAYIRQANVELTPELQAILDKNDPNHCDRQSWLSFQSPNNPRPAADGLDLLDKLLVYNHHERLTAQQAVNHSFFDPVRDRVLAQVRAHQQRIPATVPPQLRPSLTPLLTTTSTPTRSQY